MRRDMHALARVLLDFMHERVGRARLRAVEEPARGARVAFARRFAVPAGAFRVGLVVEALVGFACPGEGVVEGRFGDFVVVVDKLLCVDYCVVQVAVSESNERLVGVSNSLRRMRIDMLTVITDGCAKPSRRC